MAHYATLRDYAFAEDLDDIRGADLYAADGRIGTVKDVVFNHDTGDIQYLVGDLGHDRLVLVDTGHVFRPATDEDAFETDLTAAEAARLPRFDEKALANDKDWQRHHEENRRVWSEREKRYEEEFERKWEEDPVMHRKGSERVITPPDVTSAGSGERIITGADLTPRRIADKFAQRGPMTVPSSNEAVDDLTLRPTTSSTAEGTAVGNWQRSERLRRFQTSIRSRIPELRQACDVCCGQKRRVA